MTLISLLLINQDGNEADLTDAEKEAIKSGLATPDDEDASAGSHVKLPLRKKLKMMVEKQAQKRQDSLGRKSKYCSGVKKCILPVASTVEQFWSQADQVLCKRRSSMSPLIFELIMYLKYNDRLWDIADVVEANNRRKNESKSLKTKKAAHRAKVEDKLKEITEWDEFYAALADIEEDAAVEELLDSDDEDEVMNSGNVAEVDLCDEDDSSEEESDSDDDDYMALARADAARARARAMSTD